MKKRSFSNICLVLFGVTLWCMQSCSGNKQHVNKTVVPLTGVDSLRVKADSLFHISRPVMGYRFVIHGDFDGDGKPDTLVERFTDSLYQKEAAKYYTSADTLFDYSDGIFLNNYLGRQSFLEWKERKLHLEGGHSGFHYIENCGDVNNDGKDEILLVRQWDDYSNLNTAYVYACADGKWEEIYRTPIWEWQFPPTPSVSMIPGLFGNFQVGKTDNEQDDALLEEQLKGYRFISHYSDHSIEFSGRNDVGVWDDDAAAQEFETMGDQAYIKKYFIRVMLNDSLYLKRKNNPSVFYKVKVVPEENIILFPLDDGADMITTRIFINHPQSPLKNKPRK